MGTEKPKCDAIEKNNTGDSLGFAMTQIWSLGTIILRDNILLASFSVCLQWMGCSETSRISPRSNILKLGYQNDNSNLNRHFREESDPKGSDLDSDDTTVVWPWTNYLTPLVRQFPL